MICGRSGIRRGYHTGRGTIVLRARTHIEEHTKGRFRIIVNEVDAVPPPQDMPNLPVAKVLWEPRPNLEVAGAAWIHAGGAHHSAYTQGISLDQLTDYAEKCGVELVVIGADSELRSFKQELRQNEAYFHLRRK